MTLPVGFFVSKNSEVIAHAALSVDPTSGAPTLTTADGSGNLVVTALGGSGGSSTVQVTANVTISVANANVATYNGNTLEFTGAFTVTLAAGLPANFGFTAIPPTSGNASIASDGTTTLNGATTTLTRAAANYSMFFVAQRSTNANAYVVN